MTTQSETALRNRAIKKTLEAAFGKGRVSVRGSRGTAYGWVSIDIDWTPLDVEQSHRMHAECKALLHAAGINLGTTYSDDTCQWAMDKCHLGFNRPRYHRTMKHSDGTMSVLTSDDHGAEWTTLAA